MGQVLDFTTKTDKAIEAVIKEVMSSGKGLLIHLGDDPGGEVPFMLYRIRCKPHEARILAELAELELQAQQIDNLLQSDPPKETH